MKLWTNFAKSGSPGKSTNSIEWTKYLSNNGSKNYIIIDKRKNLRMFSESLSLNSLADQLFNDKRLNELEKCVVLLQMYTYVGSDQYHKAKPSYRNNCSREDSENFIKENASFIEF